MSRFRKAFIGDKVFYRTVLALVIPVIIQNSVTNFVNLLDNIMVGQLGEQQISGVAIANQLIFVFNLCIFGGLSGPGIFGAQFFGAENTEGLRNTYRIKLWLSAIIGISALTVFIIWPDPLISLFLQGEGDPTMAAGMLAYGKEYLLYMLPGLLPFALSMCYATTLRETGETMLPMKASIAAVLTNLVGNWLLIFGNLGFPAWGVKGAAIATVFSRLVELAILLYSTHRNQRFAFMHKIYQSLKVPRDLLVQVIKKGTPLLLNEALWSLGMTALNQAYSVRDLMILSALTISSTVSQLFNVFFFGIGNAVAVMTGHSLGAGNVRKARQDVWRLMFLAFTTCIFIGLVLAAFSGLFPQMYNITQEARDLAARFLLVSAMLMPFHAVSHCCYFTLRSGGSTVITFLFDSAFTWLLLIPLTQALVHLTDLPILPLFFISQSSNIIKFLVGLVLVHGGRWQRNIVSGKAHGALE